MEIRKELAVPELELGKPELQNNRLLNDLKSAINAVEDEKVRQTVSKLFYDGGFLFEKKSPLKQQGQGQVNGLVVALDKSSKFVVSFIGGEYPGVTLIVGDLQDNQIAYLTLSSPPNIRPELWNRWLDPLRGRMTDEDKRKLLQDFTSAKLDLKLTREKAVTEMWKYLKGIDDPLHWSGALGNLGAMGRGWGDFVDARHNVLHPQPPPKNVIYDSVLPDEPTNLVDESRDINWEKHVRNSFSRQYRELLKTVISLEGITGHEVISFKNLDFEMLPTNKGLEIFNKLKIMIPTMLTSLTEEEIATIFEGFRDEEQLPDWFFVMKQLGEGIRDGFFKNIEYVAKETKEEREDDYYQKIAQKENKSRKFRFLAQILAQKINTGIKWRFIKEKSEALQELARMEKIPVKEIAKKYGL